MTARLAALAALLVLSVQSPSFPQDSQESVRDNLAALSKAWGTRWYHIRQRGPRVGSGSIQVKPLAKESEELQITTQRIERVGAIWVRQKARWTVTADSALTPKKVVFEMRYGTKPSFGQITTAEFTDGTLRKSSVRIEDRREEEPRKTETEYPKGTTPFSLLPVLVSALPYERESRQLAVAYFRPQGEFEPVSGSLEYRDVVILEGLGEVRYFGVYLRTEPKDRAAREFRFYISDERIFLRRDFDGESVPEQWVAVNEDRAMRGLPKEFFEGREKKDG